MKYDRALEAFFANRPLSHCALPGLKVSETHEGVMRFSEEDCRAVF